MLRKVQEHKNSFSEKQVKSAGNLMLIFTAVLLCVVHSTIVCVGKLSLVFHFVFSGPSKLESILDFHILVLVQF